MSEEMRALLQKLRKECVVGFVGGSDFPKQVEQLGSTGMFTRFSGLLV